MDVDKDYENMQQATREWESFKKANNFRGVDIKTCASCQHVECGYEGERDCEHPERYNDDELGRWCVSGVDDFAICDKWEAK